MDGHIAFAAKLKDGNLHNSYIRIYGLRQNQFNSLKTAIMAFLSPLLRDKGNQNWTEVLLSGVYGRL